MTLGLGTGFYGLSKVGGDSVEDPFGSHLIVPVGGSSHGSDFGFLYGVGGVVLPETLQSTIRTSFTFSCWVVVDGALAGSGATVTFLGSAGNSQDQIRLGVVSGKASISITQGSNTFFQNQKLNISNGWHHYVFVITDVDDGAATTFKLYIDGAEDTDLNSPTSTITGAQQGAWTSTNNMGIGNQAIGDSFSTDSKSNRGQLMSMAAIWSVALSAENVAEIYGLGGPKFVNTPGIDLPFVS